MIADAREKSDPSSSQHQDEARNMRKSLEHLQCLESKHGRESSNQEQMQPYAYPCINDVDSPDNKHAQSRNNNTQEDGEQDDIKRRRLPDDKEFRVTRQEIK